MEKIYSVLNSIFQDLGLEDKLKIEILKNNWMIIFDKPLSHHTLPVDLKNEVLLINVDSPVWLEQLSFLKQEFLNKLQPYSIKDIRLKLGRVYVRMSSQKGKDFIPKMPQGFQLSQVNTLLVEEIISTIKDDELRSDMRRLITRVIFKNQAEALSS